MISIKSIQDLSLEYESSNLGPSSNGLDLQMNSQEFLNKMAKQK